MSNRYCNSDLEDHVQTKISSSTNVVNNEISMNDDEKNIENEILIDYDEKGTDNFSGSDNIVSNQIFPGVNKLPFSNVFTMGQEAIELANLQKKRMEKLKGMKDLKIF